MKTSARHVLALDGVRGLAVIAVFLYHAGESSGSSWLAAAGSWGWMGVDLFFALSGYLITGILLDALESESYYRRFYYRRLLRIAPAMSFLLLAVLAMSRWTSLMHPAERSAFNAAQSWYWTYLTNLLVTVRGWGGAPFNTAHLWSLAVEEQFYLVWPFLIAWNRGPRRTAGLAIATISCAMIVRTCLVMVKASDAAYVLMPARADALAWGALLASFARFAEGDLKANICIWLPRCLTAIGTVVLAIVILRLKGDANWASPSMQVLGYPAIAMLSAALVSIAASGEHSWLSWRPLRIAGKYSYAAYLWHPIAIVVLLRVTDSHGVEFVFAVLAATIIPVAVSWLLVERPALLLKDRGIAFAGLLGYAGNADASTPAS